MKKMMNSRWIIGSFLLWILYFNYLLMIPSTTRVIDWKSLGLAREMIEQEIYVPPIQNMSSCGYEDTYLSPRTYGGERKHYGTDIFGEFGIPIQSMTYGIVTNLGWNELGGWRVGITSPNGIYYYYAHLSSYSDIQLGEIIEPGTILGYMGNSGYGPEGTINQFVVHLHLGIQAYPSSNDEGWVNPYPFLIRFKEKTSLES